MGQLTKKIKNKEFRKFFSSDSYDRNLELMELLITDRTFKQIVYGARKRLNIPPKGIDEGSGKALNTVQNPLARFAGRYDRTGYLSRDAYVVLDKAGQVVTSWSKSEFGTTIKYVLNTIKK